MLELFAVVAIVAALSFLLSLPRPLLSPFLFTGPDARGPSPRRKTLLRLKEASEEPITTIVSLSNIVTVVGEIAAEDEVAPEILKRISKTEIVAHGETPIGRVNRFFTRNRAYIREKSDAVSF